MKAISTIISIFLLTGCVSSTGLKPDTDFETDISYHQLLPYSDLQYMSCDNTSFYPDDQYASVSFNFTSEQRQAAEKYFMYAIMSNNVYRDPEGTPLFAIPGWNKPIRSVSDSGLVIEEVRRVEDGVVKEVAVVFKGTDFNSRGA